jgi:hypothetical protein
VTVVTVTRPTHVSMAIGFSPLVAT